MSDAPPPYSYSYGYGPQTGPVYSQPQPGYPMPNANTNAYSHGNNMYSNATPQPMVAPQTYVPPGLQYLMSVDQLLIHQKMEMLEAISGWETQNRYTVKNTLGQKVYFAGEESDFCGRTCCGPNREFSMKIVDNNYHDVATIYRPMACLCESGPTEVSSPPGNIIGFITQEINIAPRFKVKNPQMEPVLRIEGPLITTSLGGDVNFNILTADGSREIGKIKKQWGGIAREMFTDADNFSVSFPMDLDVNFKCILMAAVFLIDFRCFESNN
ncbi:phospholipid scramblase 2-like isoform X2 [Leptotrombidium deliense]|uniref:Phospholipid scramblase n=1 Tax=Leptotrombidium deliense TaxID=299467 RepID=A0A443SVY9_9ACAR|nr:phospholipid scramblase 2-like isoform X2 [Leptotrombidium deliense]